MRMLAQPVLEDVRLQDLSVRDTHQNYWGTNLLWIDVIGGLVAGLFQFFLRLRHSRPCSIRGEVRAPTVTIRENGDIMKPTDTLTTLFRHNLWANLHLLEICAGLTDDRRNASTVGTYGSIQDILRHIVTAERSYLSRISTGQPYRRPKMHRHDNYRND